MTQRFTVELERIDVLRLTLEVTAEDLAQAHEHAVKVANVNQDIWKLDRGAPHLLKITAHAEKVP